MSERKSRCYRRRSGRTGTVSYTHLYRQQKDRFCTAFEMEYQLGYVECPFAVSDDAEAVSYTHLDVYKRQLKKRRVKSSLFLTDEEK